MKIKPLEDRIVVEPDPIVEKTVGGIVLAKNAQELPSTGTVVAVGPGRLLDSGVRAAMSVSVGDRVAYGRLAGTQIEVDDDQFWLMRESEIIAILEEPTEAPQSQQAPQLRAAN